MFNYKSSYKTLEYLANIKFVEPGYDYTGQFPIPIITNFTSSILYIDENHMSLETYKEKCDELWKDILKHCDLLSKTKKKLDNKKFVERADPVIVDKERKKKKFYDNKISQMNESLSIMENYLLDIDRRE